MPSNSQHIVNSLLDEVARSAPTNPQHTDISLASLAAAREELVRSVVGLDPKGKIVVIRLKPEVISQAHLGSVRRHLETLHNVLTTHGALGVIVAPDELKLEVLSDEDLQRAGLTRIKKGPQAPPVRKDILPCEEV
jgi:hypothetical protein